MADFRNGGWCTVWSVEPFSPTATKGRISASKKDKETGEYVDEFTGFVMFVGTAAAEKALKLKERDRIKMNEVSVKSKYVKEKNTTYYNFYIYSFDTADEANGNTAKPASQTPASSVLDDNPLSGFGNVDPADLPF